MRINWEFPKRFRTVQVVIVIGWVWAFSNAYQSVTYLLEGRLFMAALYAVLVVYWAVLLRLFRDAVLINQMAILFQGVLVVRREELNFLSFVLTMKNEPDEDTIQFLNGWQKCLDSYNAKRPHRASGIPFWEIRTPKLKAEVERMLEAAIAEADRTDAGGKLVGYENKGRLLFQQAGEHLFR